MKFTLVLDDETRINLHKANKSIAEELEGTGETLENILLIKDKMKSISNNMDVVTRVAQQNARTSRAVDSSGKLLKYKEQREVKELNKAKNIELSTSWAYDEFLFRYADDSILPNSCCSIEVVTPEVAKSNDRDMNDLSAEEWEQYKVGEVFSEYSKLDDKYYFKFM